MLNIIKDFIFYDIKQQEYKNIKDLMLCNLSQIDIKNNIYSFRYLSMICKKCGNYIGIHSEYNKNKHKYRYRYSKKLFCCCWT